jgi:hypothetical protein
VRRTGSEDQVVVAELLAVLELHDAPRRVDRAHFAVENGGVPLLREDVPDCARNRWRRESGGRDLVQERREQVVIRAIDHSQLRFSLRERLRSPEAAEAAADDDDAW